MVKRLWVHRPSSVRMLGCYVTVVQKDKKDFEEYRPNTGRWD